MDTLIFARSAEGTLLLTHGDLPSTPIVATIGVFDGVHLGHQFLVNQLKEEASRIGLPAAVITFDRPPISVVRPNAPYDKLQTEAEKIASLQQTGVEYVIVLPFDASLAALSAEEFLAQILVHPLRVHTLLMGYDHHFGRPPQKGMPPVNYAALGANYGINILPQKPVYDARTALPYSSTSIRQLLREGALQEANRFLGYTYSISGKVVNGQALGRTFGYPTANIHPSDSHKLLPLDGVYAVWVQVETEQYGGMLYIGKRPTLGEGLARTIEVNLFNFEGDLYQQEITLQLIAHTRGEERFATKEALIQRLNADFEEVHKILSLPY